MGPPFANRGAANFGYLAKGDPLHFGEISDCVAEAPWGRRVQIIRLAHLEVPSTFGSTGCENTLSLEDLLRVRVRLCVVSRA